MPSILMMKRRIWLDADSLLSLVVWQVQPAVKGSDHSYKYRLAYVVKGECLLRYDNEAGKGDHKHLGSTETAIEFMNINQLVDNFIAEVNLIRRKPCAP